MNPLHRPRNGQLRQPWDSLPCPFLIPSKKRLPYFSAHSFRLAVPGAITMRADSMIFEKVRKLIEFN